jgi:hypothetical protein
MRILVVIGAAALLSGTALAAETNPLYQEQGSKGVNPLYEGKSDHRTRPDHTGASDASAGKGDKAERTREPKTPPVRAEKGDKSDGLSAQSSSGDARKGAMSNAQSNPLYQDKGQSGTNPLHKSD